jgi:hypothetical protein
LPGDWPKDDDDAGSEFHVEFIYAGAAPTDFGAIGVPLRLWVKKGLGGLPPGPVPSPGPAPAPSPQIAWIRSTRLQPGDHVRVSLAAGAVAQAAAFLGLSGDPTSVWAGILQSSEVQDVLHAQGGQMQAWVPGQPLPADWPTDDPDAAGEYHVEFTYGAGSPVDLSTSPLPLYAWVGKGLGA